MHERQYFTHRRSFRVSHHTSPLSQTSRSGNIDAKKRTPNLEPPNQEAKALGLGQALLCLPIQVQSTCDHESCHHQAEHCHRLAQESSKAKMDLLQEELWPSTCNRKSENLDSRDEGNWSAMSRS